MSLPEPPLSAEISAIRACREQLVFNVARPTFSFPLQVH